MYTNGLSMSLASRATEEKESMERKYTDSSVKKEFRTQWPVLKIMLTVFWAMKWTIMIDFLEKLLI